ncbi:MAG TPA: carboxypeptidase regulatory-like domain-containing protein [Phycisphaerales bacterium]|nr:carboxypeptidase regulatory-like domain-containing protein [Phycisphaerales bacterium]
MLQDVSEDTTSLQLTAPQTLAGRIEDIHGNAVAEANVNVQFRGSSWSSSLQGYTAKTDQDGLYRIAAVPSEQQYFLSIAGPRGYGTGSQALELSQDSFETTVPDTALKLANLTVTGQVVDEDGNPLEGVNLHCYGAGQPSANVRTDKDGRFVFDAVCQGDLSVQANYQKGGEYMYSNIRTEGGAQEVTIVLSPQSSGGRFVPRQPASLVGKPLPDLSGYGIKLEGQAGPALVASGTGGSGRAVIWCGNWPSGPVRWPSGRYRSCCSTANRLNASRWRRGWLILTFPSSAASSPSILKTSALILASRRCRG